MAFGMRKTERAAERARKRLERLGLKAEQEKDKLEALEAEELESVRRTGEELEETHRAAEAEEAEQRAADDPGTMVSEKEAAEKVALMQEQKAAWGDLEPESRDPSLRGRAALRDEMATRGINQAKAEEMRDQTAFDFGKEQSWSGAGGYNYTYVPGEGGSLGHIEIEGTRPEGSIKPGRVVRVGPRFGDMEAFSAIMNERTGDDFLADSGTAAEGGIQIEEDVGGAPVEEPAPPTEEGVADQETGSPSVDTASDEAPRELDLERSGMGAPEGIMEQEPKEVAKESYALGLDAAKAGNYEEALQHFLASNEATPTPSTLYNIARTYRNLNQIDKAWEYLDKANKLKDMADVKPELAPEGAYGDTITDLLDAIRGDRELSKYAEAGAFRDPYKDTPTM
tara:strand:- start:242 stop:1432 length:1191 start_codon:yes stop_codon:yes gene_type:complete